MVIQTSDERNMNMKDLQLYQPFKHKNNLPNYLPQPTMFSFPTHETNEYDVELARIQENTQLWLASEILDAYETVSLISDTESIMSQALELHRINGTSFTECTAKTKLSGLFGKSCTMSVKYDTYIGYTHYRGWLK